MATILIAFVGRPGDDKDLQAHRIVERHDGKVVASGTFLMTSERDLEAEVPADRATDCLKALKIAGFDVERRH